MPRLALALVLALAAPVSSQTVGGTFTESEIAAISDVQAEAAIAALGLPQTATLSAHGRDCDIEIVMPGNINVLVSPTGLTDPVGAFQMGTDINDPAGSSIIVNRAGRYLVALTIGFTAPSALDFEVHITKNGQKTDAFINLSGTLGPQRVGGMAGAHLDFALSDRIRVGFTSTSTSSLFICDVILFAQYEGE